MPKFYFDADVAGVLTQDDEGQDLVDRRAAGREAVAVLSEMARSLPSRGADGTRLVMLVRDEAGTPVVSATLSLVVKWTE